VKVLLLSAYAAQSHVHWQRCLQLMFNQWQWTVLSLPPRHFSWRVRGNPLYWAVAERERLEQDYDLLVATSMVDLATLRGLVPTLASLPAVVYFHENQFEYPQHGRQHSLLEAQMVSLYSAMAADRTLFNSAYNLQSFLAGCAALLDRLPDRVPPGVIPALRAKSSVLPVPVDPVGMVEGEVAAGPRDDWPGLPSNIAQRPLRLLWAGRFEHDKGGEGLLQVLLQLEATGPAYELAVIGQQFRSSPQVFAQIETDFSHRLVQFGFVDSTPAYRALLRAADVVLSTALHEFQGVAVLEAVASGCLPAVPNRLAYPEIYPARFCYASHPDDPALEARAAAQLVGELAVQLQAGAVQAPDVTAYTSHRLQPQYREVLLAVAGRQDSQ